MRIYYRETMEARIAAAICAYSYGYRDNVDLIAAGASTSIAPDLSAVQCMDVIAFLDCFPESESIRRYMRQLTSNTVYFLGVVPDPQKPPALLGMISGVWFSDRRCMYLPVLAWLFFVPNRSVPPALRSYFEGNAMAIQRPDQHGSDALPEPGDAEHWREVFRG